jgi:hypothetical protein
MIMRVRDGAHTSSLFDVEDSHALVVWAADDVLAGNVKRHSTDPVIVANEDSKALVLRRMRGGRWVERRGEKEKNL